MSGSVDVLAAIEREAWLLRLGNMSTAAARMMMVYDVLSELIESSKQASATLGHIYHTTPLRPDLEQHAHDGYQRLDAAIAAVSPLKVARYCDHSWVTKTIPGGFATVCQLCGASEGGAALARIGAADYPNTLPHITPPLSPEQMAEADYTAEMR